MPGRQPCVRQLGASDRALPVTSGTHGVNIDRLREMMGRQVKQMVRLIDDLLDMSRITRGHIELR